MGSYGRNLMPRNSAHHAAGVIFLYSLVARIAVRVGSLVARIAVRVGPARRPHGSRALSAGRLPVRHP